ncbi:flagellar hook capping FlgD N-terminal domain-containing protein [Tunturiibacter gelidoferens]|uniref:Basal-body rod modification protein FlgD n=3 Tax=Tunturiibacter TaxID=3154218 RepID=A0A7Y9NNT3_9BACT|nr:flagellar hook capping FlgD N-terminal domain-containing protein [Edaphobacter lichenicola]MBB5338540.1 flagellar basal-body rod modification protein FlgD [Edaphobacter lichenicola]NYF52208.1 flagellar basal-body rod modification protein FlgD [Edaphobacter lichenicola]
MDWSLGNLIAGSGSSAAGTVASALAPRSAAVKATPKDSSSSPSSASSSSAGSSDITSQDFLTLLVSELKNQDPTQPTDPNQYITQLAQVNSLEQLISINQGIGTLDGAVSPSSGSGSGSGSGSNAAAAVASANAASGLQTIPGQNAIWGGSTAS